MAKLTANAINNNVPVDAIDRILANAPNAEITTNGWDRMAMLTANAINNNVPANAFNRVFANAPSVEITTNNWDYMIALTAQDPGTNNGWMAIDGTCGMGTLYGYCQS